MERLLIRLDLIGVDLKLFASPLTRTLTDFSDVYEGVKNTIKPITNPSIRGVDSEWQLPWDLKTPPTLVFFGKTHGNPFKLGLFYFEFSEK